MPIDRERLSGKNGYIRVIDDANRRIAVPIVSWEAEITTIFQELTTSCNYSPQDGVVYKSSVPSTRSLAATIQGFYRRSNTPEFVIRKLYDGNAPFRVELGYSPLDPFVDMWAWIESFRTTNPILETVRFSCSLRSEGTITNLAS